MMNIQDITQASYFHEKAVKFEVCRAFTIIRNIRVMILQA